MQVIQMFLQRHLKKLCRSCNAFCVFNTSPYPNYGEELRAQYLQSGDSGCGVGESHPPNQGYCFAIAMRPETYLSIYYLTVDQTQGFWASPVPAFF